MSSVKLNMNDKNNDFLSISYLLTDINSCRYEIVCQLGDGGFGTVYAATRLDDGLQVSVFITISNRIT